MVGQAGDAIPAPQSVDDRPPQVRRARGGRVARRGTCNSKCLADYGRNGVDRSSDRQIDQTIGMLAGFSGDIGKSVPGKHR